MKENIKKMSDEEREAKIRFILEGLRELGCFLGEEADADSLFSLALAQQKGDELGDFVEL